MVIVALAACAPPEVAPEVAFVRGGLVVDRHFQPGAWAGGKVASGHVAPSLPSCVPVAQVELEDMDRLAAMGAPPPAAALAFSPDGAWLAIASDGGSIRVVDGWTGAERARVEVAEGAAKSVAWSLDGATLYVGEQSPDAFVSALDPATLAARWRFRLADDLDTSALPPGDDAYGIYSLPAAFSIDVLPGGDLLVAGAHGWAGADGRRRSRSRAWRLAPDGSVRGAWPAAGPADAILLHPAVDGDRAIAMLSRSAEGEAPAELPVGGAISLRLGTMELEWARRFEVLPPFSEVFAWDAVDVDADLALVGLGDGRAFLLGPGGAIAAAIAPGVPLLSQGVPIASGVGFGDVSRGTAFLATTETTIPFGAADPAARPPTLHPAEDTLWAFDGAGSPLWSRKLDRAVAGVTVDPTGQWLAVGGGPRRTDARRDLFGALLLDPRTGNIVTSCPTEGPVHFRLAWAPDGGRLALVEGPFLVDGAVRGAFRVTVMR